MSRYKLKSPKYPQYDIAVGWNKSLLTYFCIIQNLNIDKNEADPIILWVGVNYDEVRTVEEFAGTIPNYLIIPVDIVVKLKQDAREPYEPTYHALQSILDSYQK